MTTRAIGPFEVKLTPQGPEEEGGGSAIGRMLLHKTFHGDLDAVSRGQMLAAGTSVKGSAGYVAIERVEGSLHGRPGTFVLQHRGVMTRGTPELSVTVVPDSGTGELEGLDARMEIVIEGGRHSYVFDYSIQPPKARGGAETHFFFASSTAHRS